jgi:hypothetical protein
LLTIPSSTISVYLAISIATPHAITITATPGTTAIGF